jgi:O-antigen ligase
LKHPWFGTGTGDIRNAFTDEYNLNNTPLAEEYRMRAHSQYLGFGVTFGIPGMIIALALMVMPWLRSPNRSFYPFVIFISIIFMSMFNDDTFGSFTGATFFSYFYTLLLMFDYRHET